jgi:hypothetical protein
MRVGETGCHRTVSPFSRSRIRHCSGRGPAGAAPARRPGGRRSRYAGAAAACPAPGHRRGRAAWLISARRVPATARRVEGRRRGFRTFRAGLSAGSIRPSSSACLVQAAQGGDEVLGGAAPAAGVPPGHDVGPDVLDELPDLRRRGLVDAAAPHWLGDPVPVRAVCLAAAIADQGRHDRDVLGEGRAAAVAAGAASRSAGSGPCAPARAWPRRPRPARWRLSGRQVR